MQVRYPKFDFTKFRAHWARNPEFAQTYNANSICPAYIEPYLVKVMSWAKRELDPSYEALHEDMKIFIRQEVQHCKQHVAFNKFMHENGYQDMLEVEKQIDLDYQNFLSKKSLRFNLAYCEGFEALGSAAAEVWFHNHLDQFLDGADDYAVQLWLWHLAEEFEHRTVCYDVFKTMYAKGFWNSIVNGYFYRLYGFFYAIRHIYGYTSRCMKILMEVDRKNATPEELKLSIEREKAVLKAIQKATLPKLLKVLSPFYNPRNKRAPQAMTDLLARYAGTTG